MSDSEYRAFVQNVIDNIKKHGFPDRRVAFPLEQLYEAAHKKGINFNKVLDTLEDIQIAHSKNPEKIIFFPKDRVPPSPPDSPKESPFPGFDPSAFAKLDPGMLGDLDIPSLVKMASGMMQKMSPEQLEAMKKMYDGMSDEDRAAILDKAKKLGLF